MVLSALENTMFQIIIRLSFKSIFIINRFIHDSIIQSNWKSFYRERDHLMDDPNRQSSRSFVQLLELSTNFTKHTSACIKITALVPKFQWKSTRHVDENPDVGRVKRK